MSLVNRSSKSKKGLSSPHHTNLSDYLEEKDTLVDGHHNDLTLDITNDDDKRITNKQKERTSRHRYYLLILIVIISLIILASYLVLQFLIRTPKILESDYTRLPTVWIDSSNSSQLNHSKVAMIMETRADPLLIPLIIHFAAVLGDDWPIHVFHSPDNLYLFTHSASFQKYVARGRFKLTELPMNTIFTDHGGVNAFMAKRWLWDRLEPASHVLVFQLDSMICANSNLRVEDFFQYDMIGAPINKEWGGANGGLSLRRREKLLEVIDKFNWEEDKLMEDVWFFSRMQILGNCTLPELDVSKTFGVETIWHPRPLGYHQGYHHHWLGWSEISSWCPENKLATTTLLHG